MSAHPEWPIEDQSWWWACEHPERPFDYWKTLHCETCYPCWLAGVAAVRQGHGSAIRLQFLTEVSLAEGMLRTGRTFDYFSRAGLDESALGASRSHEGVTQ